MATAKENADKALADAVERGVRKWVEELLHNSPFSRDTEAWNYFTAQLPSLAPTITGEIK